jgi:DNA-binding transcriptional regulator GbsR (MarR family)
MDDPPGFEEARRRYIDTFGEIAARSSLPSIAGRIAAILYMAPEPLSFSALQKTLGVSRASISTNTRLLEYLGTITRIKIKGQRENFFRSSANVNVRTIEREHARAQKSLAQIVEASRGLAPYAADLPVEVRAKMDGIERLFRGRCEMLAHYRDLLEAELSPAPGPVPEK